MNVDEFLDTANLSLLYLSLPTTHLLYRDRSGPRYIDWMDG